MIFCPRAVQKSSKASAMRAHGSRYAMTRCEIHGRNGNFKPRAIIAIARIFLRLARLRASRGAIPGRAGPPHRSAGARRFFFSVERRGLQGGHDQTHLSSSSLDHCPSRERHRRPTQKTMGTTTSVREEKRIRHHDRALCDRTRPKRDRNETYRVCERKHGTCFSSVFVRRRPRV